MTDEERAESDRLLEAYLQRPNPRPTTREDWLAQLAEWEGKVNIESLLVWGSYNGWERDNDDTRS